MPTVLLLAPGLVGLAALPLSADQMVLDASRLAATLRISPVAVGVVVIGHRQPTTNQRIRSTRMPTNRPAMDGLASGPVDPGPEAIPDGVQVELYAGARETLRPLFELAEDSPAQLDSYLNAGRVLVARSGDDVVGHLQLVNGARRGALEIKNMAVRESWQRRGVGARLVRAAIDLAGSEAALTVLVATATADIGNLRFYQRQGFRMRSIKRDAFTEATGYPPGLMIDGIGLRDRVWLDYQVDAPRELGG